MKKVIIPMLALALLPGCIILNKDELGLKRPDPVSYKDKFWKVPCFVTGKTLKNISDELKP